MSEAFSPEILARQIVLRYRGEGHLRFALPAAVCEESFATAIEGNLRRLPGVYRVTLYRQQGKLSVFFDRHACGLHEVACCLHGALVAPAGRMQREHTVEALAQRLHVTQPLHWLRTRTRSLKETAEDMKLKAGLLSRFAAMKVRGNPALKNILTERAMTNFFNDVVAFYLIKVHWDLITQKWLKQPVKFRSAWLTAFYLVFLMVRYRKQPPGKT